MNLLTRLSVLLVVLSFSCTQKQKETTTDTSGYIEEAAPHAPKLVKQWETDSVLKTCESVLYDKSMGVLYVSNINGTPLDKNGSGFISKIDTEGNILEEKWITGLNAPKGMGLVGSNLYVTDIDQVVAIDVNSGEVTQRYDVADATFLNDIATSPEGTVLISDSNTHKIHELKDESVNVWMHDTTVARPNGLLIENNRVLLATMGNQNFNTIDKSSKEAVEVADGLGMGDGVVADGEGNYLVSNWQGEVYFIDNEWNKTKVLDTKSDEINAADIEFIPEMGLLLVPTFFNNRVAAYKLEK